jgi:preprotein translocase subunit SecD
VSNKRLWASLLGFSLTVAILFGLTIAFGRTPVLGLDLKGGLSVIYATAEPADQDELIVVRDLMRDQLESFGIAEPDVRVEGKNIIVDLPGVSDQSEAFDALKVSGIVELRPVIQCQAGSLGDTSSTVPGSSVPGSSVPSASTVPGSSPSANTAPDSDTTALGLTGGGAGSMFARGLPPILQATPDSAAPPTTTPTTTPSTQPTAVPTTAGPIVGPTLPATTVPVETAAPQDTGQDVLDYPDGGQVCLVGPAGGTGEVFKRGSAAAGLNQNQQWIVTVDLREDGQQVWNALATECFNGTATCPSHQLAIVLDDVIESAPTVQTTNFQGSVQITGAFSEDEVRSLARVLNRGAFPVTVVQQRVETVSPTAGKDSFRSAVLAGLIGVLIMLAFMVWYYRKLSVVIIYSLVVWGLTVFVLASFISNEWSYAFTIAGATGIIISVGVTVDTYVVFFERIRDDLRHGRSIANAAPRAFKATWTTILAANFISLLAAVVLFWLSVGSVKGFALYLGLTTVCDVAVFWFVARPATFLLAQTNWLRSEEAHRMAAAAPIGASS